jgi:hypothetical protein
MGKDQFRERETILNTICSAALGSALSADQKFLSYHIIVILAFTCVLLAIIVGLMSHGRSIVLLFVDSTPNTTHNRSKLLGILAGILFLCGVVYAVGTFVLSSSKFLFSVLVFWLGAYAFIASSSRRRYLTSED